MTRLLVHVEGQTEESFVANVLAPHLCDRGFSSVVARLIGNARQRGRRGGIKPWPAVRSGIVRHLRQDRESVATTLVDYYGLPRGGADAWPGRAKASSSAFASKAELVQKGLLADVRRKMGTDFNPDRFVPYVAMHEFEAMLFSDCKRFGRGVGRADLAPCFQAIRDSFATPEEIDDSPSSAPSKRIEDLMRGYEKPLMGPLAALEIGLRRIRAECPHFSSWMNRLERLP